MPHSQFHANMEDCIICICQTHMNMGEFQICTGHGRLSYLLTNWLAYLYGRIQSPRPNVMPDRREGITRATGFVFACIDTQTG